MPIWARWVIWYAIAVAGWATVVFGHGWRDMYEINRRMPIVSRFPIREGSYEAFVKVGISLLLVLFTIVFVLAIWSGK